MSKRLWLSLICLGLLAGCQESEDSSGLQNANPVMAPYAVTDVMDMTGSPDADIWIHAVSMDESTYDLAPAGVFIQPDSWNQKYALNIQCHEGAAAEQQIAIVTVSEDVNYHAIHQTRTIICQNDPGSGVIPVTKAVDPSVLSIHPDTLNIEAGQNGTFDISLSFQPQAPVLVMAIPLNNNHDHVGSIFTDPACLSDEGSAVIQTNQSDSRYDIEILTECTHEFDDLLTVTFSALNLDKPSDIVDPEVDPEDPAPTPEDPTVDPEDPNEGGYGLTAEELFEFSKTYLYVRDTGSSDGFTMRLLMQPEDDVIIELTSSNTGEVTVEPSILTFTHDNWSVPQNIRVTGVSDGIKDGTQLSEIHFEIASTDDQYDGFEIPAIYVQSSDDDAPQTSNVFHFRVMAANITSGKKQAYSPGHGIRIFQAVEPDIVLINEFNMYSGSKDKDSDIRALVDKAFGPEFYYHHGNGALPNGIVSRYPITSSGAWDSNIISNRDWDWAVIDIPGDKDILAVSVHLSTDKNAQEMPHLITEIEKKIDRDAKNGIEYYVLLGGDFNTTTRKTVKSNFSSTFVTSAPYPVDQNGNEFTNAKRTSPYDWLLCSRDLCKKEVPVEIGAHTGENAYPNGHVFDTRVYGKYSVDGPRDKEISYVAPAQANDSGASNMQHMAVIRDFEILY